MTSATFYPLSLQTYPGIASTLDIDEHYAFEFNGSGLFLRLGLGTGKSTFPARNDEELQFAYLLPE